MFIKPCCGSMISCQLCFEQRIKNIMALQFSITNNPVHMNLFLFHRSCWEVCMETVFG